MLSEGGIFESTIKLASYADGSADQVVRTNASIARYSKNREDDEAKRPINLYRHNYTVYFPGIETSRVQSTAVRLGGLTDVNAAETYLKVMLNTAMININTATNAERTVPIVDNRLMYFKSGIGGERHLINAHRLNVSAALERMQQDFLPMQGIGEVRYLSLNFSPKDYVDTETNLQSLTELKKIMTALPQFQTLMTQRVFSNVYSMFSMAIENKAYQSKTKGFGLGFLVEYLCAALSIPYSEGCKSNKDRGSSKKMYDEIYLAKLFSDALSDSLTGDFGEFFTLSSQHEIEDARLILEQSSSSLITELNTSVAGNINLSAITDLLKEVLPPNIPYKTFFTGMGKKLKTKS